jgi:hypothetical protein
MNALGFPALSSMHLDGPGTVLEPVGPFVAVVEIDQQLFTRIELYERAHLPLSRSRRP